MNIILLSESDYLLGLLKVYCLFVGCEVKATGDYGSFLNTINNNNPPTVIFIELAKAPQLFAMVEWQAVQRVIKKKKIVVCSLGKPSFGSEDIQTTFAFDRNFTLPFREDEMQIFLQERFGASNREEKERRFLERRKEENRRILMESHKILDTSSDITSSNSSNNQQNKKDKINIGPLVINYSHKVIKVNDVQIELSPKEFEIIDVLASHLGRVVKTEEILKAVWAEGDKATKADVYQYVHMLRKKIETDPAKPQIILTVKGLGYELGFEY